MQFIARISSLSIFIARNDSGKIVAWASVGDYIEDQGDKLCFDVFVSPEERRKGIASKLLQAARDKFGDDLSVSYHDEVSKAFYDKAGLEAYDGHSNISESESDCEVCTCGDVSFEYSGTGGGS